jgi:hypothetical protein
VAIYGAFGDTTNRQGYTDVAFVGSSARQADIPCNWGDVRAVRCQLINGMNSFATTKNTGATNVQAIDLRSRMPDGSEVSVLYGLNKLE